MRKRDMLRNTFNVATQSRYIWGLLCRVDDRRSANGSASMVYM